MSTTHEARIATHGRATADTRDAAPFSPAGLPAHAVGYRALKLWQRALDVAADVHLLTRTFPDGEQDGLGGELRRAAASVPAAVAAGSLAGDRADHQRALQSAVAAVARVETLAALAERLGLVGTREVVDVLAGTGDVTRLLRGLTRFLAARDDGARVVAAFDTAADQGQRAGVARVCDERAETSTGSAARNAALGAEPRAEPLGGAPAPAASGPVDAPAPPPSMRRRAAGPRGGRARGESA